MKCIISITNIKKIYIIVIEYSFLYYLFNQENVTTLIVKGHNCLLILNTTAYI